MLRSLGLRSAGIYDRRPTLGAYAMGVIHPGSAMRSHEYMDLMIEDAQILKPLLPQALAGTLLTDFPDDIDVQD